MDSDIAVKLTKRMLAETSAVGELAAPRRSANLIGGQGRIKRLLNRKDTFQGTIGGVAGVWQRPKRGRRSRGGSGTIGPSGLKLLVAYGSRTHYQPRFDFYGIARRSVPKIVGREMDRAITKALQSAR